MTLQEQLQRDGIAITPIFDGQFHREKAQYLKCWTGKRKRCVYGDFSRFDPKTKSHFQRVWPTETDAPYTPDEIEELKKAKAQAEAERKTRQEETALEAQALWDQAKEGPHPYLDRKKIQTHGTRVMETPEGHPVLLVPMYDFHGKLWNLQRIYSKKFKQGDKFMLPGGKVKGLYYRLGEVTAPMLVCEGFATGASLHEATGLGVFVAFSSGNLVHVVKEIGHPQHTLICADNDQWKPDSGNAGLAAAQAIHDQLGSPYIYPHFSNETGGQPTDFNDLHCLQGLDEVQRQVRLAPTQTTMTHFRDDSQQNIVEIEPKEAENQTKKEMKAHEEMKVASFLLNQYGERLLKQDEDVFEFQPTTGAWLHYKPKQARDHFMCLIDEVAGKNKQYRAIQSIWQRFLLHVPYKPREINFFAPPPHVTHFKNGALELKSLPDGRYELVFRPKAPTDYLCYTHPFDYVENAPLNDEFEETVKRVLPEEAIGTFFEVLGACLIPAFPKVVFFVGPPGSGKSTLILFAHQLMDAALKCAVDPSDWKGFGMETMAGKLVNLITDISTSRAISENILKQIEDRVPIRISRKGITDIYGPLPAMHLFGANTLPKTVESLEAFTRRVLIFRCDRYQAPESGFIRNFAQQVWQKNPQGILMRAIEGAGRLARQGGHFTAFEGSKQEMIEWQKNTGDFVQQFIADLEAGDIELADKESVASLCQNNKMTRNKVWEIFSSWFEKAAPRRVSPTRNEVYSRLRELGIKDKKIKGVRYFEGFKVTEGADSHF